MYVRGRDASCAIMSCKPRGFVHASALVHADFFSFFFLKNSDRATAILAPQMSSHKLRPFDLFRHLAATAAYDHESMRSLFLRYRATATLCTGSFKPAVTSRLPHSRTRAGLTRLLRPAGDTHARSIRLSHNGAQTCRLFGIH